jgi:uncharacterized protein (DUF2384 family)
LSVSTASSGFSYPSIVAEIRRGGLTSAEIGAITGVRERQVQNWAAGTSRPAGDTRDRLVDVYYIIQQLQTVYTSEGTEIWLHARNPGLHSERPIDLLVSGNFEPVLDAVERLTMGAL